MRGELWGAKYSMFKSVCRRIWLTFLIFILFFGTIEPSLNLALAQDTKRQTTNYDLVKPLDNQQKATKQVLNESYGGELEDKNKITAKRQKSKEDIKLRTPFSKTFINTDGTKTLEYLTKQKQYLFYVTF